MSDHDEEEVLVISVGVAQMYTWASHAVPGLTFTWNVSAALDLDDDWTGRVRFVDIAPLIQAIKQSLEDGDPSIDIQHAMGPAVNTDQPGIAILTPFPWVDQFLLIDGWHRVFRLFTRGAVNVPVVFLTSEQERAIRISPSQEELDAVVARCLGALERAEGACAVCSKLIVDEPWFAEGAEGAKYDMFAVCSQPCQRRIQDDVAKPASYWESRPGFRGMA